MKRSLDVRAMVLASIFAALMAVCAWISLPVLETAFTMQTFGVFLALGILGGKWGTAAVLIYLLLGAAGLPVFSGFRGGLGILLGPSGGYLLGFLASGIVYWLVVAVLGEKQWTRLAGMVLGQLACYGFGSLWFALFYLGKEGGASLAAVVLACVAPYLIPDGCKLTLAFFLSRRLRRQLPR